jgi:hypothetical protein
MDIIWMYMRTLSFKMPEESQQEMCLPVREKAKQDRLERYNMETYVSSETAGRKGHLSMVPNQGEQGILGQWQTAAWCNFWVNV